MDFWSSVLATFLGEFFATALVAAFAAYLAYRFTDRYAAKRELASARHARNLAAAEQLYSVYGEFFAAWKAWEYVKRTGRRAQPGLGNHGQHGTKDEEIRSRLSDDAAQVEGKYEAVIIRASLERPLSKDDLAALWALRFALKQLRYAIRNDSPLRWWRSEGQASSPRHQGYREYQAFKFLAMRVAGILATEGRESTPSLAEGARAFAIITGTGDEPGGALAGLESHVGPLRETPFEERWVAVAEVLDSLVNDVSFDTGQ